MPRSGFYLAFCSFTFFMCISYKICECSYIKFYFLISKLPPVCQIKLSATFLESHNLQESKVPFEIIKLRIPNNTNISFSNIVSENFGFLPRPANRSNCAINFHYFRTSFESKRNKEKEMNLANIFTYSVYITNTIIKTRFNREQNRYTYYPHSIWLLNAIKLRSLISTEPFLVSQIFYFVCLNESFISRF